MTKATERAVVFNSGYASTGGVVPAFAGPAEVVLSDAC